jgi:hypothetical protein
VQIKERPSGDMSHLCSGALGENSAVCSKQRPCRQISCSLLISQGDLRLLVIRIHHPSLGAGTLFPHFCSLYLFPPCMKDKHQHSEQPNKLFLGLSGSSLSCTCQKTPFRILSPINFLWISRSLPLDLEEQSSSSTGLPFSFQPSQEMGSTWQRGLDS